MNSAERRDNELPCSSRVSRVGEVGFSLPISHSFEVENLGGEGKVDDETSAMLETPAVVGGKEFVQDSRFFNVSEKERDLGEGVKYQVVCGVGSDSGDGKGQGKRKRVPTKKYDKEQYVNLRYYV